MGLREGRDHPGRMQKVLGGNPRTEVLKLMGTPQHPRNLPSEAGGAPSTPMAQPEVWLWRGNRDHMGRRKLGTSQAGALGPSEGSGKVRSEVAGAPARRQEAQIGNNETGRSTAPHAWSTTPHTRSTMFHIWSIMPYSWSTIVTPGVLCLIPRAPLSHMEH